MTEQERFDWLIKCIAHFFNQQLTPNDFSQEAVLLSREEIETNLLPKKIQLASLPPLVMVYFYQVTIQQKDCIGYFLTDEAQNNWYVKGLLYNHQLLFSA